MIALVETVIVEGCGRMDARFTHSGNKNTSEKNWKIFFLHSRLPWIIYTWQETK